MIRSAEWISSLLLTDVSLLLSFSFSKKREETERLWRKRRSFRRIHFHVRNPFFVLFECWHKSLFLYNMMPAFKKRTKGFQRQENVYGVCLAFFSSFFFLIRSFNNKRKRERIVKEKEKRKSSRLKPRSWGSQPLQERRERSVRPLIKKGKDGPNERSLSLSY